MLPASVTGVGEDASSNSTGAICLRGLFKSSSVMPSSLVMPTTGGSPFFTNSHWPVYCQHEELTWLLGLKVSTDLATYFPPDGMHPARFARESAP